MDVEKLGIKKRSVETKSGIGSEDEDEPIGSIFKVKSRRNPKKVKVESDVGVVDKVKKLEVVGCEDREFGGMDDTLAILRKKLKGPKKDSRVSTIKGSDLDVHVKKMDCDVKVTMVTKEKIVCEDGVVENVKKGLKNNGKEKIKRSRNKTLKKVALGENVMHNVKEGSLEKKKRPKSKLAKKEALGENLGQNDKVGTLDGHLEDSLSVFLLKAQFGSQKSRKTIKRKQVKTTPVCIDGMDQKFNKDPVHKLCTVPSLMVEIDDEKLTDDPSKDPAENNVVEDELNISTSAIAKLAHDLSNVEVQKKKTEPSCSDTTL